MEHLTPRLVAKWVRVWAISGLMALAGCSGPLDPAAIHSSQSVSNANNCLVATEMVDVRDRTVIRASVGGGNLELGADSRIEGDVVLSGNAFLRERSQITGSLTLQGSLSRQNNTSVGSLVAAPAVDAPAIASKTFTVGTGWAEVPNDAVRALAPGDYGNMTIRARSRVTLTAGTYHFASLAIEGDVVITLDTSAGSIELDVAGSVDIYSRASFVATQSNAVAIYSNGSWVRLYDGLVFPGPIVAPFAEVTVYSRTIVNGCIAGRIVRIGPDGGLQAPACAGGTCQACERCTANSDCTTGECTNGRCGFTRDVSVDWLENCREPNDTGVPVSVAGMPAGTYQVTALGGGGTVWNSQDRWYWIITCDNLSVAGMQTPGGYYPTPAEAFAALPITTTQTTFAGGTLVCQFRDSYCDDNHGGVRFRVQLVCQ